MPMSFAIAPSPHCPITLGIVGGGQLGRMMAIAAHRFGLDVSVLHPSADCPAAPVSQVYVGNWTNREQLGEWAQQLDVVTLEHEFVSADDLDWLASRGINVRPGGKTLGIIQDKWLQRHHLQQAGLTVPSFRAVDSLADLENAAEVIGWPLVVKTRRLGYDGHGTAIARNFEDLERLWQQFNPSDTNPTGRLLAEAFVPFEKELAVMVARRPNGDCASYPVTETVQKDYICDYTLTPAVLAPEIERKARDAAIAAVRAVESLGAIGVELFLTSDGTVWVNELAPRPHNSGHYTLDACVTDQFEQHVRAVLDLPLGATDLVVPCVVMANILGTRTFQNEIPNLSEVLKLPHVHLHWYGKRDGRVGRKLGHMNAIAANLDTALDRALKARDSLGV
jgi:5-(carboxyamino)imidazole ribonucleotide synthase